MGVEKAVLVVVLENRGGASVHVSEASLELPVGVAAQTSNSDLSRCSRDQGSVPGSEGLLFAEQGTGLFYFLVAVNAF